MTVRERSDSGFTIIEAMVAVTVLAFAVVLSIQPVISTLGIIEQSRVVSTAENLAQAEIEQIRAIGYPDVGLVDSTPAGVLERTRDVTVEGSVYTIDVSISYAGSVTGLDVVDGGGDGVPGAWDPGVDYKYVVVTVTPHDRVFDPVVMETIVSPPDIGAHESIANVRITIAPYEPFGSPTSEPLPSVKITSGLATYRSIEQVGSVVFPGVTAAQYEIGLNVAGGWKIHPDDVLAGETVVVAVPESTTEGLVRIYRQGTVTFVVTDSVTGASLSPSSITLTRLASNKDIVLATGETVASNVVPDTYDIAVSAANHHTATLSSVRLPSNYPEMTETIAIQLDPTGHTFVDVDVYVEDGAGVPMAGAVVTTDDPVTGEFAYLTGVDGHVLVPLPAGFPSYIAAHTVTGHEAADTTIDAADTTSVTLTVLPPDPSGDLVVDGVGGSTLVYRIWKHVEWIEVQPNADGVVSLALAGGSYEIGKLCSPGNVIGKEKVVVRNGRTTTTTITHSC